MIVKRKDRETTHPVKSKSHSQGDCTVAPSRSVGHHWVAKAIWLRVYKRIQDGIASDCPSCQPNSCVNNTMHSRYEFSKLATVKGRVGVGIDVV